MHIVPRRALRAKRQRAQHLQSGALEVRQTRSVIVRLRRMELRGPLVRVRLHGGSCWLERRAWWHKGPCFAEELNAGVDHVGRAHDGEYACGLVGWRLLCVQRHHMHGLEQCQEPHMRSHEAWHLRRISLDRGEALCRST